MGLLEKTFDKLKGKFMISGCRIHQSPHVSDQIISNGKVAAVKAPASSQTHQRGLHIVEEDYKFDKEIGKGTYGCVRICKDKESGSKFACKTIYKVNLGKENQSLCVQNEVEIMKYLNNGGGHPGILSFKDFYEDSESFHLITELCSKGRLKMKHFSERQAAQLIKDLMSALKYCHIKGVVHRDIKPENILFTKSGTLKLADFGEATTNFNGQKLSYVVGTPGYVAPEIVSGDYSEKVDIWSAGVILYQLLSGEMPFRLDTEDSFEKISEVMKKTRLDFTSGIWKNVSPPARDLVGKMLCTDVSLRPSAHQVLNHNWITIFTDKNWQKFIDSARY